MSRTEWQFWTNQPALPRLPDDFRILLTGMVTSLLSNTEDRIEFIEDDLEVVPGIKIFHAPGHTPGHMAVHIASEKRHFLYLSDAVIHKIHIRKPHWSPLVDIQPERAIQTRQ
ncbi:hypothetical protein [Desulfovibrio inopinatus]|uniref:hypothetical protein n=1 Tax=Desulfovibrio inopinatus TaxID=102109 RepID=UPI00047F9CF6|nr:hypothetical protein [Desulfovibrio inopinatus]